MLSVSVVVDVEVEGGDVGPILRIGINGNILVVVSGWVEVVIELRDGHAFDERRALANLPREQSDAPTAQLLNVPFAVVVSPTGSPNSKAESSSLSDF